MDARIITEALGGKWYSNYGLTYCPAHENTQTPALSLADGKFGLLATCHAGCTFRDVMAALCRLGLSRAGASSAAGSSITQTRRNTDGQILARKRAMQAACLWKDTVPIVGTLAETYLRTRGIKCTLPESLRFAPSCWHATSKHFPALLAVVEGVDNFAVHRTYLCPDGSAKAEVMPGKAMLGAVAGGAVRLSETVGPLLVCEGIETGLSLASGLLSKPASIWAALSTSGMKALHLPMQPGELTIASDGDKPGRAAAHALAVRATAVGWRVSMLPAPAGQDWNDVLVSKGGKA